ncbi:YdcF family protein [Candidatus Leptofilum sp.]|uniref:YdcF family protein n=1 Tax=Candidatus Leptofilum sp. TaxID=3241576 RepID=UPI003B5C16A8
MKIVENVRGFRARKFVFAFFAGSFALFFALAIEIVLFSTQTERRESDIAIVLGAAVWGDEPSSVFLERINHAVELRKSDVVDYIIFTGGVGDGDNVSEAEVGKATAVSQGIHEEDIFVEMTSTITYENLTGACMIMEEQGWDTAVLVSDPLHMKRAITMASDLGLNITPSPTLTTRYQTWRSKLPSLLYETWFYALYLGQRPFLDQSNCGVGNSER